MGRVRLQERVECLGGLLHVFVSWGPRFLLPSSGLQSSFLLAQVSGRLDVAWMTCTSTLTSSPH